MARHERAVLEHELLEDGAGDVDMPGEAQVAAGGHGLAADGDRLAVDDHPGDLDVHPGHPLGVRVVVEDLRAADRAAPLGRLVDEPGHADPVARQQIDAGHRGVDGEAHLAARALGGGDQADLRPRIGDQLAGELAVAREPDAAQPGDVLELGVGEATQSWGRGNVR